MWLSLQTTLSTLDQKAVNTVDALSPPALLKKLPAHVARTQATCCVHSSMAVSPKTATAILAAKTRRSRDVSLNKPNALATMFISMQKVARIFRSHAEAEKADREFYRSLTPSQRL